MGVLDKLRIAPESGEEYPSESGEEFASESVEDSYDESDPNIDPSPGQSAPRTSPRPKSKLSQVRDLGQPRVTKRMKDDAQAEIQSMVELLALAWGMQAPPCGEALEQAAPAFSEKLTKIVARNPRWLQRVRDGGLLADVLALGATLVPVGKVARTYYTQPQEGGSRDGVEFDPDRFAPYDGSGFSRAG